MVPVTARSAFLYHSYVGGPLGGEYDQVLLEVSLPTPYEARMGPKYYIVLITLQTGGFNLYIDMLVVVRFLL